MKKLILLGSAVLILAAGCNKTASVSTDTNANQSTVQNTTTAQTSNSSVASTTTPTTSNSKSYSLPICGITLTVKNGETVAATTATATQSSNGLAVASLTVGKAMPASDLYVSCTQKDPNPSAVVGNDIGLNLSVQSDGSSKVDKNSYSVFDSKTSSIIPQLYSAMNRGYRQGSETIGFSAGSWLYEFSFLNPAQDKNQNDFVISVNPTTPPVAVSKPNIPAGTENWNVYTSSAYGFSFRYPSNYTVDSPTQQIGTHGLTTIVSLTQTGTPEVITPANANSAAKIYFSTDNQSFSVTRIAQDYVVNGPDMPTQQIYGTNTWYDFSGGGGGVLYNDDFYYDLNGKLLQVSVLGPYSSDSTSQYFNHPDASAIESGMLASFTVQ